MNDVSVLGTPYPPPVPILSPPASDPEDETAETRPLPLLASSKGEPPRDQDFFPRNPPDANAQSVVAAQFNAAPAPTSHAQAKASTQAAAKFEQALDIVNKGPLQQTTLVPAPASQAVQNTSPTVVAGLPV